MPPKKFPLTGIDKSKYLKHCNFTASVYLKQIDSTKRSRCLYITRIIDKYKFSKTPTNFLNKTRINLKYFLGHLNEG